MDARTFPTRFLFIFKTFPYLRDAGTACHCGTRTRCRTGALRHLYFARVAAGIVY